MKSSLVFKRNTTDKLSIKGTLSDDCTTITYTNENGDEKDAAVSDLLNAMKNQFIELNVQIKTEEELEVIPAEDADSEE
ncbi:MAG TPA: hypothetical protein DCW90_20480 [Lachnospiraceae bacterium]|nr:hypothetical protein [Lachnospiraceae bacterium]